MRSILYYIEEIAILPQHFEMYMFALKLLGQQDMIEKLYIDIGKSEEEFIKDVKEDYEIDEECKKFQIDDALHKISMYRNSYRKVKNGEIILNYYEPFIENDCYLFSCLRHENPVYSVQGKVPRKPPKK